MSDKPPHPMPGTEDDSKPIAWNGSGSEISILLKGFGFPREQAEAFASKFMTRGPAANCTIRRRTVVHDDQVCEEITVCCKNVETGEKDCTTHENC